MGNHIGKSAGTYISAVVAVGAVPKATKALLVQVIRTNDEPTALVVTPAVPV